MSVLEKEIETNVKCSKQTRNIYEIIIMNGFTQTKPRKNHFMHQTVHTMDANQLDICCGILNWP